MAVTSINLARVSHNLRAYNLLESIRLNQRNLFNVQTAMATGLRFQRPSDDPLRAAAAVNLDRRMDRLTLVQNNLSRANAVLTEVDTAMQEALDLLTQAQGLAVQAVGETITPTERHSLTVVVDSILRQLVNVGNSRYQNTYLFSGHASNPPFELKYGGVLYTGDDQRLQTLVDPDLTEDSFTVPGQEFFLAVSSEVRGVVDLDPALSSQTLISDLNGALGRGVRLGRIVVTTIDGQTEIDLTGAATAEDLIAKLNAGLPPDIRASLGSRGIVLTRSGPLRGAVTISDAGGGRAAADLGLAGTFAGRTNVEADLDPRLTLTTRLADLAAGDGLDLRGGLVIRNGTHSATINLDDAETIEDILNRINQADVGVWARVADDGKRLEVRNRVSGIDLTIEENGGTAATVLGLRTMHGGTPLSSLNAGRGVRTIAGADFRISTRDGTNIDIDVDGVATLQELIDRINEQAGGAVTVTLAAVGNGLVITDHTAGGGTLSVTDLGGSLAAADLGLNVTATDNRLVGRDVNPVRVDSPFTALLELSRGMTTDDRVLMMTAGERIDRVLKSMQEVQGKLASRARVMADRAERVDSEVTATRIMLSDVRDVDIADAAVRFQQLQTALQANLSTALRVLNLSVLDYLR